MTIIQTVEIPDSRLITVKVPGEIPAGKARLEMKLVPYIKNVVPETPERYKSATPHTDALLNLLSGIGEVDINNIRDERLAKHSQ